MTLQGAPRQVWGRSWQIPGTRGPIYALLGNQEQAGARGLLGTERNNRFLGAGFFSSVVCWKPLHRPRGPTTRHQSISLRFAVACGRLRVELRREAESTKAPLRGVCGGEP